MELRTRPEVDELLRVLANPDADDAYLSHATLSLPFMQVNAWRGYVYLTWTDATFLGSPVGDPASPASHGAYNPLYFAGTGLMPAVGATAIEEWLVAPHNRPRSVRWVAEDALVTHLCVGTHLDSIAWREGSGD